MSEHLMLDSPDRWDAFEAMVVTLTGFSIDELGSRADQSDRQTLSAWRTIDERVRAAVVGGDQSDRAAYNALVASWEGRLPPLDEHADGSAYGERAQEFSVIGPSAFKGRTGRDVGRIAAEMGERAAASRGRRIL